VDLEGFSKQRKFERGDWAVSSMEENRGLTNMDFAAIFIGGTL
jgi:hypothetical protein